MERLTLEQIEQRVWHIEQECGPYIQARAEAKKLKKDLQALIAARALPITREWCREHADKVEEPVEADDCFLARFGDVEAYHFDGDYWKVYRGNTLFKVKFVGKLLDLLSVFGVTK